MNRTDRMLAIVLELQNKGRQRAEDLASLFETSKRTIYRDIQALSEAGVPLMAVPGQGYTLMEGYFLPPLTFTTDEATVLLLGSDFVAQNFDAEYQQNALSAARKLESVLPQKLREEVRERQNSIRFIIPGGDDNPILKELRRAILDSRTVSFCYQARQSEQPKPREADPYGLVFYEGDWFLSAYCHLRKDLRNFRLDRISEFGLTSSTFARPPGFQLNQDSREGRDLTIKVLFDSEGARYVKETHFFYIEEQIETPQGLLVILKVRQEQDALRWILGWGNRAKVLEPQSLRELVKAEVQKVLELY